jgi:hypothetical protein
MKGNSYEDFVLKAPRNATKSGFCLECGVELPPNEGPYCVACEHVYQEWQESLREE